MAVDVHTKLDDLFAQELELCGIEEENTVAVVTQGRKRLLYADGFRRAAESLGASAFHVDLVPSNAPDDGGELGVRAADTGLTDFGPVLVSAFQECDLVVDLVFLLWSEEQAQIKSAGTRMLSCVEPPATLRRLFPFPGLREGVLAARQLLEEASQIRIVDETGTDVTYDIGQYRRHHQYGIADEPGRWDHFASAMVGTVGNDEGVNGTVILKPGDIVFPYSRYIADLVEITIRDGRVERVEGGLDAAMIREYLESFDDERGYGISHIGWGMHPGARWDALSTGQWQASETDTIGIGMDSRSYLGRVMFSTGPNVEFGGDNDTACHLDIPMQGCSVYLDDEPVIDRDRLLPDEIRSLVQPEANVA
ncbi:MAG: leucyl aminopeptidase [Solirubrobacterales bacterium]